MKDPSGNALFVGFVDVVKKQGAGFYGYLWPKPGFDQPVGKISYVKGFAPWGWIIGTGIYLDDVDAVFRQNAMTFALVCLVVFVLVLGASFVIGRSVTRPLAKITGLTQRLASSANSPSASSSMTSILRSPTASRTSRRTRSLFSSADMVRSADCAAHEQRRWARTQSGCHSAGGHSGQCHVSRAALSSDHLG